MKIIFILLCSCFLFGFTHPFAQDGAVESDSTLLRERQEDMRARQKFNSYEQEKQESEEVFPELLEVDPDLDPEADFERSEGSID